MLATRRFILLLGFVLLVPFLACGGGGGSTASTPTAPTLTGQPRSLAVDAGSSAHFTVSATGSVPLAFQWRKGGVNLPGATTSTFTIAQAQPSDAGSYDVVVSNAAGSVTSQEATLTVTVVPPSITQQPVGKAVVTGAAVTFSVTAAGSAPLSYQWSKDGAALSGATGADLPLPAVTMGDAGTYKVLVSNAAGQVQSDGAVLTVALASTLDLSIANLYVTQSTQTAGSTVPLVVGKDALVRVFVLANTANAVTPQVRLTISNGAAVVKTYTIPAPGASVPLAPDEATLASSWNQAVPGTYLQAGCAILAEVDPGGSIPESDKTNNAFPVSGTPMALNPVTLPTFAITLIPVVQSGLTGNATEANKAQWMSRLAPMGPIAAYDVQVGAAYTTSTVLQSDGTGWDTLLGEIEAKRQADGNLSKRTYYGAVNVSYASGTAGEGYVPGSAGSAYYRSAVGWDKTGYQDGGNYPEVLSHEVGHTFGRNHSPCGTTSGLDPSYPYAGGILGTYGYDTSTGAFKDRAIKDVMSYCSPQWISDYTYKGMLTWRQASIVPRIVEAAAPETEGLLVWGRRSGGAWVLEPAFRIRGALAFGSGTHAAVALDGQGRELARTEFELARVADGPEGAAASFTCFLPLGAGDFDRIASLRILEDGSVVAVRTAAPVAEPKAVLRRLPSGGAALRWTSGHPAALVRDAVTGEVVAIARDGAVELPAGRDVDVEFSDGLHTWRQRLTAAD